MTSSTAPSRDGAPVPEQPQPDAVGPGTGADGPSRVSPSDFKAVFRRHPAGVAVVTFTHDGVPYGFTATSVISVSADPPVLTFSIDSTSSSWPALAEVDTVVINFLAAAQVDVSARFATRGIDRFAEGGWSQLATGEPVLDGNQAWVRGRVVQRTAIGRSFLVSVLALEAHQAGATEPLVYHDRSYHAVGEHTAI